MNGFSLTRAEAARRASEITVRDYRVLLDLAADGFRSRSVIGFACRSPGSAGWVDLVARQVMSAELNGRPLVDAYDGRRLVLPSLEADNLLIVESIHDYSTSSQGLHRFVDPADDETYVYSHLQPAYASHVFACFDQPDLKAPFSLTVTTPPGWTVLSNGPVVASTGTRHAFAPTPPISTYLVALVAGPFTSWGPAGKPPIAVHARRSLREHVDADHLAGQLRAGLDFFAERFGIDYPFAKLDLCFVPEFSFGAMENAGCVMAGETFVFDRKVTRAAFRQRSEMLLHELSHQWFGNLVTFRWWDDLWLNESFATWAALHAQTQITEFTDAWAGFAARKKSLAYELDQAPSAHPVIADVPDVEHAMVTFDALTYHKGASVLSQLVTRLGTVRFFDGIRKYLAEHAYGVAEFADVVRALGVEDDWVRRWLTTTGTTTLRVRVEIDGEGLYSSAAITQEPAPSGDTGLLEHRITVGVYDESDTGSLVRVRSIDLDVSGAVTELPQLAGARAGLLVLPNDDDLTYAHTDLDHRSLTTVIERVTDIPDALARSLCWSAAWGMTRRGGLASADFLRMATRGLAKESQIGVVQRVLRQSATVLSAYTDPDWSDRTGWPQFVDTLVIAVGDPATSADHRLAFARAVAAAALTPEQQGAVREWLDGALPMDTDLRWRLVRALVAHGHAPPADLARPERTAADESRRAQLEASVPTMAAKTDAWREIVDPETPAGRFTALVAGFRHPAQRKLLESFVDDYVRDIPGLWRKRPHQITRAAVTGLFPHTAVSPDTVDALDLMLADDLPPALRVLVRDECAELLLALTLRKAR